MGVIQSSYLNNIREHFSVEDPLANLKKLRYGKFVPTRRYIITPGGRFNVGMFSEIVNYIRGLPIPYKIIITEKLKEVFFADYNISNIKELNLPLRTYQKTAVERALKQGNGILEIGTGGGKTLIMASIIHNVINDINKTQKILVVVPGIQLVEQTYQAFLEYGIDRNIISRWSGNHPYNPTSQIIIASLSILQSKKTNSFNYENVDLLLFDECLRAGQKIETINGIKTIEDISIGDFVLSYNSKMKVNEYKEVTKKYVNMIKTNSYKCFFKITLEHGEILEVTPNHKIYTINRGFVRADELTEHDDIKIL